MLTALNKWDRKCSVSCLNSGDIKLQVTLNSFLKHTRAFSGFFFSIQSNYKW